MAVDDPIAIEPLVEVRALCDDARADERFETVRKDLTVLCEHAGNGARVIGTPALPLKLFLARKLSGDDHLDRDQPFERDLPRLVDHAHPAASQLLQQFVVAKDARQRNAARRCAICCQRSTTWRPSPG